MPMTEPLREKLLDGCASYKSIDDIKTHEHVVFRESTSRYALKPKYYTVLCASTSLQRTAFPEMLEVDDTAFALSYAQRA
jgi:type IV secretory pathway component VirB8